MSASTADIKNHKARELAEFAEHFIKTIFTWPGPDTAQIKAEVEQ